MTVLQWDQVGERLYETGVDHGVLYQIDESGPYVTACRGTVSRPSRSHLRVPSRTSSTRTTSST